MLCEGHHDCIDNGTRYEGYRLKDEVVGGEMYGEMEGEDGFIGYNSRFHRILDRDTGKLLKEVEL